MYEEMQIAMEHSQLVEELLGGLLEISRHNDDMFSGKFPLTEGLEEVSEHMSRRHSINFYPSRFKGGCCSTAVFCSLLAPTKTKKPVYKLSFERMLMEVTRHMQGSCADKTNTAILVVDNWNPVTWMHYLPQLQHLKKQGKNIAVFMVTNIQYKRYSPVLF